MNLNKFWKKRSVTITEYDPTYKVVYLGNVLTAWAKGEGCVDKPLATLWKNYCQNSKPDVCMKVTVCNSGLKAITKEHGLTEYWAHRVTYSAAHAHYPRVFCWVYRHEGKKLRQELRCHAVLCAKDDVARRMAAQLQLKLALALQEFRREKICRQNARLSLANSVYDNPSLPRRKILLSTGSVNYRPPLERSKSAPKLMVIDEVGEAGDAEPLDEGVGEAEQFGRLLQERLVRHRRRQQRLRFVTDAGQLHELDEEDRVDDDDDVVVVDGGLEVSLLLDPTLDCDAETFEDDDDAYNTNPMVTPTLLRRLDSLDVDEDLTPTPPSTTSSSSSSSPSSSRMRNGSSKPEEDTVSDESGYSEDNGAHLTTGARTYTCGT